ncbi:GntR family transcriptional regulator [Sedimentitalea todarodis]|uniref:GntR family transcriptional regulator n=1 Tax=Sedimentitalea todarodis TaxID=1631240 RepID=A0ABU3VIG4_9RHOB|nr:GntR family transcriptional regulator [Sedimentitalea todarodis]MDU9005893.1 GntR family transcriptional regulator [Sedimentitalea todarodis]
MSELSMKPAEIAALLAEEIIRGDIAEGARLAQDHIAERFKCSHVPAREALQRLVQMELATFIPKRGVRAFSLSDEDLDDIVEMRLALEPLALAKAIANITPEALEEMEAFRLACDNASDAISWEKANRQFHLAILRPCARPLLLDRIEQLQRLSARRFHARWREAWRNTSDKDHVAILHAMALRDGKMATRILERHLSRR